MNADTAISVSHVSKRYTIGAQKDGSLRGTLAGLIGSKSANKQEEFWALNDVSFDIKKGEVIGIIGKNGAGKSTLLKILSQITKPSSGRIEINGRVASLLEVGTGFHPELSGRENIYLNGTILGMTRQEVKDKFNEIVEFSGVEKFIDTPVKHYSSGMYVRLAFAVAAHLEPEILIIDEVLAVGDAEFQKKCLGKMKEVAGHGRTVIFVSHNMTAVKNLCNRCVVLEKGTVLFNGFTETAIQKYFSGTGEITQRNMNTLSECGNVELLAIKLGVNEVDKVNLENSIILTLDLTIKRETSKKFNFNLFFTDGSDNTYFALVSDSISYKPGNYRIEYALPAYFLNDIFYNVDVMAVENRSKPMCFFQHALLFQPVEPPRTGAWFGKYPGVIRPNFIKPTITLLSPNE
jgi:lipopolysaccharide transport system ATP-binding protein